MPEEKTVAKVVTTVKRNEVDLEFVDQAYSKKASDENKGKTYLKPRATKEDLQKIITWMNPDISFGFLMAKLSQVSQGWTKQATSEDGLTFDLEAFNKYAAEFSARGEKISELEARIEELLEEMGTFDVDNTDENIALAEMRKARVIQKQILTYKAAINEKRRDKDEVETAEKVAA